MTNPRCLAESTRAPWLKLALLLGALPALSQTVGPAEALAKGIESYESRRYAEAVRQIQSAKARLPRLADYTAYYLAAAHSELKDFAAAKKDLEPLHSFAPASPMQAKGVLLESRVLVELQEPREAIRLLRERYAELPQPLGDLALATAYEAAQDLTQAATSYQSVYFNHPATEAAVLADSALGRLRPSLGSAYPAPPPRLRLERANRWMAAREYVAARKAFAALAAELEGEERDLARVRIGAVDYLRNQTSAASKYLDGLKVEAAEANAERLYYLVECARRLDAEPQMGATLEELALHPQSRWRLKALLAAGNHFLLRNDPERYEASYRACHELFPAEPEAAGCQWKVAWSAYLRRRKEASALLREHLDRFPASSNAGAALYFLGRLAEAGKDPGAARACYARLVERFPGYYYGLLARDRMAQPALVRAAPSPAMERWVNQIPFPARRAPEHHVSSAATERRIERARLLYAAGLQTLAEAELRFGAKSDGQPHLLAIEMARSAQSPYQGLRFMKSLVSDYFTVPLDTAPPHFWELLFPLPFRAELEKAAGSTGLDPYMVAGLIRQESEFNPKAVSRRDARGLTQVRPSTGRQLARRAGLRKYSTALLFQPATNLKLGTIYLRALLDQWGGKWEQALASYNAGKSRVIEWLRWGSFEEAAEFVETIPFTETREYVQSVLRNAAIYRRLYEGPNGRAGLTPGGAGPPAR